MFRIMFEATPDQVKQIAVNAINASEPVGLGFIHYKPKVYTTGDIDLRFDPNLYIDYFEGRQVKLSIHAKGDGLFVIRSDTRPDYQSWSRVYPTAEDLLKSAGIEEFTTEEPEE